MRIARSLTHVAMVVASFGVGLLGCEVGARLVLNPADYLSATTVRDDVLGIRVAPASRGVDAWGFRNPRVPERAEIVAIGDSHTYGNNVAGADAWPSVVSRLTGRRVYTLALGGYGPNQYSHLLKAYGVKLGPRWVICGLYLGDDFENAFRMTYGADYWSFLRLGRWEGVDPNIWETEPEAAAWHERARAWLSRESVVYRLVVHGPVLGHLKGAMQIMRAAAREDETTTSLVVAGAGIREAFRPLALRGRLDQRSPAVREGMRLTFELLAAMSRTCQAHGCQLVVVLIPTKETVFADLLLGDRALHLRSVVAELVAHEAEARARTLHFLARAGIAHVDPLPALRSRVAERLYTRSDRDMHPGPNGYRVIGEAVARFFGTSTGRRVVGDGS